MLAGFIALTESVHKKHSLTPKQNGEFEQFLSHIDQSVTIGAVLHAVGAILEFRPGLRIESRLSLTTYNVQVAATGQIISKSCRLPTFGTELWLGQVNMRIHLQDSNKGHHKDDECMTSGITVVGDISITLRLQWLVPPEYPQMVHHVERLRAAIDLQQQAPHCCQHDVSVLLKATRDTCFRCIAVGGSNHSGACKPGCYEHSCRCTTISMLRESG